MTDNIPVLTYYMGKNVEDMSRDELIDAIKTLASVAIETLSPRSAKVMALGEIEMMRRELACA